MCRLVLLITACLLCALSSASAQTYEQAYQRCLRKPDFEPGTNKACTIVIDSPKPSALDRAIALNNRAAIPSGPDQAIRDLDRAIRLAPRYVHPMYNPYGQRGQVKEAMGDTKGAEADRKTYGPLMQRASKGGADGRGPNASGLRAWEPFIVR